MPNQATTVETSPMSHIMTVPSFFSPPPPPTTTTTDAQPPPLPSSPLVNAHIWATPGWARRFRWHPTTPPTMRRHGPPILSTMPHTNATSLAPDAANSTANAITSPPLNTATHAPQPCHVVRCDVSLTRETTNTKHTHKQSKAQWPSDAIHTKLVSKTLIKSWLWLWVCNLFVFQQCKGFVSPPRGSFIVVRSYLQLILRVGRS